ncbi:MAG TPA: DUF6687 family protein [Pyrinomonadaceae bacterium]|jgi:hypothetical protein
MRFEYYHEGLADVPKLSVDGLVPNAIHLTHWQGNETNAKLKADTSTEIALNLAAAPDREELTRGVELATNNHFDTDGVLSVWTVLNPTRALPLRAELIAAAEAGDFSEYTTPQAVRASLCLQGSDAPVPGAGLAAPLARRLNGDAPVDEPRAYELLLPEIERVLTRTDDYEELWREPWAEIERALDSFARGDSRVSEDERTRLSVVTLAPGLYGAQGFSPVRHAAPFTAIARHARGELFLIALPTAGGYAYRIDYPYYSWAETVVRPRVPRRNLAPALQQLNELERNEHASWDTDATELTSAAKSYGADGLPGASGLQPDEVADVLRATLGPHTAD